MWMVFLSSFINLCSASNLLWLFFSFFNFLACWPFPWQRQPFWKIQPITAKSNMSHKLRLGAIINNNKNMSKNNMSHKLRLGAIITIKNGFYHYHWLFRIEKRKRKKWNIYFLLMISWPRHLPRLSLWKLRHCNICVYVICSKYLSINVADRLYEVPHQLVSWIK